MGGGECCRMDGASTPRLSEDFATPSVPRGVAKSSPATQEKVARNLSTLPERRFTFRRRI